MSFYWWFKAFYLKVIIRKGLLLIIVLLLIVLGSYWLRSSSCPRSIGCLLVCCVGHDWLLPRSLLLTCCSQGMCSLLHCYVCMFSSLLQYSLKDYLQCHLSCHGLPSPVLFSCLKIFWFFSFISVDNFAAHDNHSQQLLIISSLEIDYCMLSWFLGLVLMNVISFWCFHFYLWVGNVSL